MSLRDWWTLGIVLCAVALLFLASVVGADIIQSIVDGTF